MLSEGGERETRQKSQVKSEEVMQGGAQWANTIPVVVVVGHVKL